MTNQKLKIILGVNLTKVCEIMCTFSCLLIYTKNLKITLDDMGFHNWFILRNNINVTIAKLIQALKEFK